MLEYRKEVEVLSARFVVVLLSMQIKCINLYTIPYPFMQLYDEDIDSARERKR